MEQKPGMTMSHIFFWPNLDWAQIEDEDDEGQYDEQEEGQQQQQSTNSIIILFQWQSLI